MDESKRYYYVTFRHWDLAVMGIELNMNLDDIRAQIVTTDCTILLR